MMEPVYICDAIRTPIGRYAGSLATIRTDDLAALPLQALMQRNPSVDWAKVDDVIMGCANQSGEDNRNIARMAVLLAGLPLEVPAITVNRLCGSGLNALGDAAKAISSGCADLIIAAGVEGMSRAPFVISKSQNAFDRSPEMFDTTMGWRFINRKLDDLYGTETMPKTAENLAKHFHISREDQDKFALWSQQKAAAAIESGELSSEILPVTIKQRRAADTVFVRDEHPRNTSLEKLATLNPIFDQGTVTAGNASGINDGAGAMLIASKSAVEQYNLPAKAKILGMTVVGVTPSMMGIGPVPATQKLLQQLDLSLDDLDVIEINEAFAAQALACMRELGLADNDPRVNRLGGAIAYGHPLGMSGIRLATSATYQLEQTKGRHALCTMCIGVGQGIAMVIERIS